MSDVIEIIPKTEIRFNGRMNSTQFVVLAERIPTVAYASGALRMHYIKIIPGDKVMVELSPFDLSRGQIITRTK